LLLVNDLEAEIFGLHAGLLKSGADDVVILCYDD